MHFQFSTQLLALSALICQGISQEVERRQGHHNNVRGGGIFGSVQGNRAIRHLQGNACDLKDVKALKCQELTDVGVGEALFQQQQTEVHVVLDMKKGFCLTDYYIQATVEANNGSPSSNVTVENIGKQRVFEKLSIPDSCSNLTINVRTNVSASCPQNANLTTLIDILPSSTTILTSKDNTVPERRDSYWNIEGVLDDFFGTRKLRGWCVDSETGLGDKYTRHVTEVISSYDIDRLELLENDNPWAIDEAYNLPQVNYLINEYPVGTILPDRAGDCGGFKITWTEIQQTIWEHLDDDFHIELTFNTCAVDFLHNESNTMGADYMPTTCDDKVAVVLFFRGYPHPQHLWLQPVIVEVNPCDCTPCVPPPEETEEPCLTAVKREDLTDEEVEMYESMCVNAGEGDTKINYYNFTFQGSYEASGWSEKNEVDMMAENDQGAVKNINSVHISCSDTFENGYARADRDGDGPTPDRNEPPVQDYQIIKFKDNCEFHKVCKYCPTNWTSDETGSPSGKSSKTEKGAESSDSPSSKSSKTGKSANKRNASTGKSSKSTENSGSATGKRGRRALQAKPIVDRCDSVWACTNADGECSSNTFGRL